MIRKITCAAAAWAITFATCAKAQDTETYFRQNCVSCHTIGGGRLTGPDLKDVTQRKDRAWLQTYIQNPQARIDAGDPYALSLLQEARGVVMPPPPGINPDLAGKLLDLIEAESALETSQFKGSQVSNAPFTLVDVKQGMRIFRGTRSLKNGGTACISCHSAAGIGGLGGGNLGVDLMRVYERLGGRTGLSAWLVAPSTVTMRELFQNHPLEPEEIHALVAFFENQSLQGEQRAETSQLNFSLLGLGGVTLGLVLMNLAWINRFRGVRRPLVQARTSQEVQDQTSRGLS